MSIHGEKKTAPKIHDDGRIFLYLLTKKLDMALKNSHAKNLCLLPVCNQLIISCSIRLWYTCCSSTSIYRPKRSWSLGQGSRLWFALQVDRLDSGLNCPSIRKIFLQKYEIGYCHCGKNQRSWCGSWGKVEDWLRGCSPLLPLSGSRCGDLRGRGRWWW